MRVIPFVAALLLAGPALAEDGSVRLGAHTGYGRVVFDLPDVTGFTSSRTGDTVVVSLPGAGAVGSAGATRNVLSVTGGTDSATIAVRHDARIRMARISGRVVVDVLDPARPKPEPGRAVAAAAAAAAASPPAVAAAATPVPLPAVPQAAALPPVPLPAPVEAPPPPLPAPAAIAVPPPTAEPVMLAATRAPVPPGQHGSAALLPFGPMVGAAAFRHGTEAWVVFDERRPVDLAGLGEDRGLADAAVTLLPAATVLHVTLPVGRELRLARQPAGWTVAATDIAPAIEPLAPQTRPKRLLFAAPSSGQVVTVPDPQTGQNLLIGTLRAGGPGIPVSYSAPEFTVLPSWQGLVVEPLSDRTVLRAVPEGFAIETGDALSPAPDAARALEAAAVLTRRFDLPSEPTATLLRRLSLQVADTGRAPPQSRLMPRKAAAQTMLALGLGAEAQSVLQLAVIEDPRAAEDPDLAGLTAIAALLSGRPNEADGLLLPALGGTDEVALWRAVRRAMLEAGSPEAAPVFAADIGLVLSYPAALRNRLLALAAETMAEGGQGAALDALLAKLPDDPLLTFARAERMEAHGDSQGALTVYDALAAGRDRLASARAATRAVSLRLATGAIGPADAAATLERGFMAWRGDNRERDLRLRAASLRAQAGQWRPAMDLLRETAPLYPEAAPLVQAQTAAIVTDLLRGPNAASVPALDLVSLVEENAEAIAQGDAAGAAALVADKLLALDLPRRAGPVIERMMTATPGGEGRARLGARLAAMRLGEGEGDAAAAALDASNAANLPLPVVEERGLLDARIHARRHDPGGAAAILSGVGTPAADDLRATILGDAGDWQGAEAALLSLTGRTLPADGPLDAGQQDLLVRLASAQAKAGDDSGLRALGLRQAVRMTGPRGDMFRLLTAAPVNAVGDLRRSAGEIALARAVPAGLAATGGR